MPQPPSPPPPAESPEIPLIRPEIPGYTIAPAVAQRVGIAALGTFHERRGDQSLLDNYGTVPGAWARVFGETSEQGFSASVGGLGYQLDPQFDGSIWGLQAGLDLLGWEHDDGSQDRLGLFYLHTEASGDVNGNTLALSDTRSGTLDFKENALGAYWTHIGATGWYLDAVAKAAWLDGDTVSDLSLRTDLSGNAFLASLEGGYPFALGGWTLEPQAQLIWQRIDLDDTRDRFSSIDYEAFETWTGWLGLRLEGDTRLNGMPVQPFVGVNLWHNFSSSYAVEFNDRSVTTHLEGTSVELRAGLSAQISQNVGAYGALHFSTDLDGNDHQAYGGNIGLHIKW